MSVRKPLRFLSLTLATLGLSTAANAAGFYLQEQSVKGLGSAFSGGVTSIDDASTIWFNPANMTKLDGRQANIGAHLLIPSAKVKNDGSTIGGAPIVGGEGGNPYDPTPLPNLFVASPLNADNTLWAGIGFTAPFGLASDYGDSWFGRYDSTKTELKTYNIQPSIAYKATNWLSVGGGVDIQYAEADLRSAISFAPGLPDGTSKLSGDTWSIGYNVGLQVKPIETTEIGLHYRSAVSHTLDGEIEVSGSPGGAFDSLTPGKADLNLPDIATLGIAHQATPDLKLTSQVTWFGWNNFDNITARSNAGAVISRVEQNYQTTWAFAVGAEYDVNDKWTVRGGYQFDETPTTDEFRTSRTPDGDRNWFSLGASYNWNENLSIDMAATYIHVGDGTINVTRPQPGGVAAIDAKTSGDVGIAAVALNYKF